MQLIKLLFISLACGFSVLLLNGCVNDLPEEKVRGYTTRIKFNSGIISGNQTTFSIYHVGGKRISSCLKKFDESSNHRLKLAVYAPCSYIEQFKGVWFNKDT